MTPAGRNASAVEIGDQSGQALQVLGGEELEGDVGAEQGDRPDVGAAQRRRTGRSRSGISGSRLRDSIEHEGGEPGPTTAANDPMVRAEAQPACCADTTV